jgi:Fe2+ transport system protein B
MTYFVNDYLIDSIEAERQLTLTLEEVTIISVVNSFQSQGQKCEISRDTWSKILRCSLRTTVNMFNKLKRNNIIKVHYPKDQHKTQKPCTTWLHEDIKKLVHEMLQLDRKASALASAPDACNNKIIAEITSPSSFKEDVSVIEKEEEDKWASLIS